MQTQLLYEDDLVLVQRNRAGCIVISNKLNEGTVRVTPKDGRLYASSGGANGVTIQIITFMGMPSMVVP